MNIDDEAAKRTRLHDGQRSQAEDAALYDRLGVRGEVAFGEKIGREPDLSTYGGGADPGYDFSVPLTIDVKTFRRPTRLLVKEGRVKAAIYVLADGSGDEVGYVGWAWHWEVVAAPIIEQGLDFPNHVLYAAELHPMRHLVWVKRVSALTSRAP